MGSHQKELNEEEYMAKDLEATKQQTKFNDWMYSKIKPFLKGDILETGSGIGTFSEKIIRDFNGTICLTEINDSFINLLKNRFDKPRVNVTRLDLNKKTDFDNLGHKFDAIYSSNVLEHIKDDVFALKCLKDILKDKGRLVLLVPAHKFLFSPIDEALGHYRRYTKNELKEKAELVGFKVVKSFWFNMFAIPARFINGNLFRSREINEGAFGTFNKLVPVFKFVEEKLLRNFTGVSLIMVLEK